jgi:hypothetical protein
MKNELRGDKPEVFKPSRADFIPPDPKSSLFRTLKPIAQLLAVHPLTGPGSALILN